MMHVGLTVFVSREYVLVKVPSDTVDSRCP